MKLPAFDFSIFPVLETKRLTLREPVLSDAADIFIFRSDSIVQRYNDEPMTDLSQVIKEHRAEYTNQERILWAVTMKEQDAVIGLVGFGDWNRFHNRAMIGYDLAHAYWGQGISSEAVQRIIRFGFTRMNLNRIEAETIEDNLESVRMLEKPGFTLEGIRRGYSFEDDGKYHGSAMYGLLRSEYDAS